MEEHMVDPFQILEHEEVLNLQEDAKCDIEWDVT
jgi:hypothetical protein